MTLEDSDNLHKLIVNYLPKKFSEDDVLHLFSVFGKVHSCKLMIDLKTAESKGWGFINYFNLEDAEKAVNAYNGLAMQNKVIRVKFAGEERGNKAQVFVSGLSKTFTQKELESVFSSYGHVEWCFMMPKGAALVKFEKKEDALEAIDGLNDKKIPNNPYPLKVSLHKSSQGQAKTENFEESDYTGKSLSSVKAKLSQRFTPTCSGYQTPQKLSNLVVTTLYISGLPENFDDAKLYKMFSPFGAIANANTVTKSDSKLCRGIAFVDMVNKDDAVCAIQSLHGTMMNERTLNVSFKVKKS